MRAAVFAGFLMVALGHDQEGPVVATWLGRVQGVEGQTSRGSPYVRFNRVPYAEAPVGPLRLRDPVAKLPWRGVLDGGAATPKCPQVDLLTGNATGQEDCLFLNIYTPRLPNMGVFSRSLKPVMLWIHGGVFTLGDATELTNPELLIDEDVVFVALQYRLGLLGWLARENDPVLPGNLGLKDQQEAMRWVQSNIAFFGGDPRKVTIFGNSAGAISAHFHILSPAARNLFRAAILQSGTALMAYERLVHAPKPKSGEEAVRALGCQEDTLACLQDLDLATFLEPVGLIGDQQWPVQDTAAARPVLPFNPLEQLMTGSFHRVPIINGITRDEGSYLLPPDSLESVLKAGGNRSFGSTALGVELQEVSTVERLITSHYLGRKWSGTLEDNQAALDEMHTDALFASPANQVSSLHGRHAPTYSYLLATRCSSVSLQALFGVPDVPEDLVPHNGDDLPCIFKDEDGLLPEYTDARANTSRAMVKAWTNFAKYLEPFPGQDPSPWPRGGVLVLQPQPRLITDEQDQTYRGFMDRLKLWDALYWQDKKRQLTQLASRSVWDTLYPFFL